MNKAILIGRLTRDPELRYTGSNIAMATFSLAVDRNFAGQNGERETDFINIVAWSKTAEFCSKYFTKGQQIGLVGRVQTRNWEDEKGQKHYVTEVVAEEVYFAGDKKEQQQNETYEDPFIPSANDDELPF